MKEIDCQITWGFVVGKQVAFSRKGQADTKPRVRAVTQVFSLLAKWDGCKKEAQQMVVHVPCLKSVCTRELWLKGIHASRRDDKGPFVAL